MEMATPIHHVMANISSLKKAKIFVCGTEIKLETFLKHSNLNIKVQIELT